MPGGGSGGSLALCLPCVLGEMMDACQRSCDMLAPRESPQPAASVVMNVKTAGLRGAARIRAQFADVPR